MPEELLGTNELQEKLNEALERAEESGEERASPKWTLQLSLSTALVAVLAAIASLKASSLANDAILLKNEAVLKSIGILKALSREDSIKVFHCSDGSERRNSACWRTAGGKFRRDGIRG